MEIVLLEDLEIAPASMQAFEEELNRRGHTLKTYARTEDAQKIADEIRRADAVITGSMPIPASALAQAENLRYIDVAFTGVDHIPLKAAAARGIAISNASGYANESVAELAIAQMIVLMRQLPALEAACRQGKTRAGMKGATLENRTVGIVGAGHIGRRTAELAKAMHAHVLAYTRHPLDEQYLQGNPIDEQVSLDELLSRSDVISLHVPLTDQTRGLIGAAQLEKMKPSAYLINTARGPVVSADALAEALEAGTIAGAAVDVFDKEPPLAADNPLLHAPHILLTPHIGYDSEQSMELRAQIAFDNLFSWLDGTIQNQVRAE